MQWKTQSSRQDALSGVIHWCEENRKKSPGGREVNMCRRYKDDREARESIKNECETEEESRCGSPDAIA